MERINTSDKDWQKKVKKSMDAQQPFELITDDPEWNPTSNELLDLLKWIFGSILPDWVVVVLNRLGVGLGLYAFPKSEVVAHSAALPLPKSEVAAESKIPKSEVAAESKTHVPEEAKTSARVAPERAPDQHDGLITRAAIAGAGVVAIAGAATVIAGILSPEPVSKGLLLATGGGLTVVGGGLLVSILYMRNQYEWTVIHDSRTGKKVWSARPKRKDT